MRCVCRKCGAEKDISEFDKKIGAGPLEPWNLRFCKACVHQSYLDRRADPQKRATMAAASNRWKQENKEAHSRINTEYYQRHPEKTVAANRLRYAIKKGLVVRQPCEICGTEERVHAHHVSYAPEDWYNVKWLCYVCHSMTHSGQQGENQ